MQTCAICGRELMDMKYTLPNGEDKFICPECNEQIVLCMSGEENEKTQTAWQTLREQQEILKDADVKSYLSLVLASREQQESKKSSTDKNFSIEKSALEKGGGLFGNVGKTIKEITKVCFWIEVVAFIIIGFVLISENDRYNPTATTGFVVMLVGPVVAWLISLGSYGFGELIDQTSVHNRLLSEIIGKMQSK